MNRNLPAFTLALLALAATHATAQDRYPAKPVRLVVPFAPGGAIDIISRAVGESLGRQLGQSIVVENRPGAGGNIGTEAVARAAPDGYTLLAGTSATHGVNPGLYAKLPYDAQKDFAAISYWGGVPNVLVVRADSPYTRFEQIIAAAKADPGRLTYGSAGSGTSLHLAGEMFERATGAKLTHVPYKGGAPASIDLLGGNIAMMFDTVAVSLPNLRAGKVRGLAVAARERHFALPDVPTFAEKGFPAIDSSTWTGMFAPRATPAAVQKTLENASAAALKDAAVQERLRNNGVQTRTMTSAEFSRYVGEEISKWGKLVKAAGIKPE